MVFPPIYTGYFLVNSTVTHYKLLFSWLQAKHIAMFYKSLQLLSNSLNKGTLFYKSHQKLIAIKPKDTLYYY